MMQAWLSPDKVATWHNELSTLLLGANWNLSLMSMYITHIARPGIHLINIFYSNSILQGSEVQTGSWTWRTGSAGFGSQFGQRGQRTRPNQTLAPLQLRFSEPHSQLITCSLPGRWILRELKVYETGLWTYMVDLACQGLSLPHNWHHFSSDLSIPGSSATLSWF